MDTPALSPALCQRILRRFGLPIDAPPDLSTLLQLVERYTRTVPWESASRIARRARHESAAKFGISRELIAEAMRAFD